MLVTMMVVITVTMLMVKYHSDPRLPCCCRLPGDLERGTLAARRRHANSPDVSPDGRRLCAKVLSAFGVLAVEEHRRCCRLDGGRFPRPLTISHPRGEQIHQARATQLESCDGVDIAMPTHATSNRNRFYGITDLYLYQFY
eukprot:2166245-Pleurochrysis_carterae.AAC.1